MMNRGLQSLGGPFYFWSNYRKGVLVKLQGSREYLAIQPAILHTTAPFDDGNSQFRGSIE